MKYIINSAYLYDNQLDFDYLFLHNNNHSIPFSLTIVLQKIWENTEWRQNGLPKDQFHLLSNIDGVVSIQSKDYISLIKVGDTHIDTYKAYDVYWDEGKSNINLFNWVCANVWSAKHPSVVSTIRLGEYKKNRIPELRNSIIDSII